MSIYDTCDVRMLLTGSTRTKVAKEASATMKGAQHHVKNCDASRY